MQNLTVIPAGYDSKPEEQQDAAEASADGDFVVLIGHRRLAAAKEAGVAEVPCSIVSNISKSDQVAIMLEENMQRNDLTIYEQAQSFQLMLDLGETEETISKKTGFGKTTIRHRLNIAKLDKRTMKRLDKDENFQLTLKDLIELEKVKDIKKRNEILRDSTNSRDLASRAIRAAKEQAMDETAAKIIKLAEKRGIKPAGSDYANHRWDGTYKTIKELELDGKAPERLLIGNDDGLLYYREFRSIKIVKKVQQEKTKELSDYQKKVKETEKRRKQIRTLTEEIAKKVSDFVFLVANGKVEPLKETAELISSAWEAMRETTTYLSTADMIQALTGHYYCTMHGEEKTAAVEKLKALPTSQQILLTLPGSLNGLDLADYNARYQDNSAERLRKVIGALEPYGFSITDEEERQIIDGTHELYTKKEQEDKK